MKCIIGFTALIVSVCISGCCTSQQPTPVHSYFRITGNNAVFVVVNRSQSPLVVTGVSGGVNFHRQVPANVKEGILGEGPDTVNSVTPGRYEVRYQKPLVILPAARHEFSVQGCRELKSGETAHIHIALKPISLNVRGSLHIANPFRLSEDGESNSP